MNNTYDNVRIYDEYGNELHSDELANYDYIVRCYVTRYDIYSQVLKLWNDNESNIRKLVNDYKKTKR